MNVEKIFASPSVQYRGKPFWAWNGKLEEQELRRQVRILRKMGLAGGFMHSRVGLDTKYLSDEWFVGSISGCSRKVSNSLLCLIILFLSLWISSFSDG